MIISKQIYFDDGNLYAMSFFLAKVNFSPLKFQEVAILASYLKNYNFGPFRPKIAKKTPRVPKKAP